ncbi:hypothetical protein SAMN04488096_104158 [Mesonia phycicola]|uniref:Methylamine utilisation protein MauE domain-containing protein n=1 Tax=Mesonia phycicola TaxID=579105 RepID=A0A1M6DTK5_9FLAO|nr:MauE/DoxX family redox-associated membrane protein [Mesonia phycicola]SHI76503.1 hypothetical protein SAMN04488096_104158 [Mesonia phycicola]
MKIDSKIRYFLAINNSAFLVAILLSFHLWVTNREFPLVPLLNGFPAINTSVSYFIFGIFVCLLIWQTLQPKPIITALFLSILGFLLVQDQMRWQPWVYIHSIFLIPFLFKNKKSSTFIQFYALILIGIYFWSGFHKFNIYFVDNIFPSFTRNFGFDFPGYRYFAYAIPIIEIVIAVGLLLKKTRKLAFTLALITHLIIVCWVNPWNGNSNFIIIPWNIAMILWGYFCFIKHEDTLQQIHLKSKLNLIAIAIVILPILNTFGLWPYYFSFNLYSGKGNTLYITVSEEDYFQQSESFKNSCASLINFSNKNTINLDKWSFQDLNVPVPAETRIHQYIITYFCKNNVDATFVSLDRNLVLSTAISSNCQSF